MPLPDALTVASITADAVISKPAQRFGKLRIVRRHHAALTGRQVLHGMKAEDGHVGNAADLAPAIFRAKSVTSIFDDRQPTVLCNFKKCIEVRGMSRIVNRKNCFRAWRDQRLDARWIKIERVWVNISENWLAAVIE